MEKFKQELEKTLEDLNSPNNVECFTEIRECPTTGSKSLHATVEFSSQQIISNFGAKEVHERPNYLTLQISDRQHIIVSPEPLQYINHSCNPNVFFDTKQSVLRAIRKIEIGEELTFFYPSTEWSMAQGFDCICQSKDCLGQIQGAIHLPINIARKYKLSQHIQQKLGIESRINHL